MTSDKTAILGGVLILAGGLALAVYANTNAEALSQAKAKTVTKYILLSEKEIAKGNHKQAEKFVIKALETDPKNKQAIAAFKKVELAAYTSVVENTKNNSADSKKANESTSRSATPEPVGQPKKPEPEEEAEEEMGCI